MHGSTATSIGDPWRVPTLKELQERSRNALQRQVDAVEPEADSLLKLMFENLSEKQLLAKYVEIEVKNDNKQKPLVIKCLEVKLREIGNDVFIDRRVDDDEASRGRVKATTSWLITFKWGDSGGLGKRPNFAARMHQIV